MVGRYVKTFEGDIVKVVQWDTRATGRCDTLVEYADGRQMAHNSRSLRPTLDDPRPIPERRPAWATDAEVRDTAAQMRNELLTTELHTRWPGVEFGKGILGKMCDDILQGSNSGDQRK